jgi:hypothetical protein
MLCTKHLEKKLTCAYAHAAVQLYSSGRVTLPRCFIDCRTSMNTFAKLTAAVLQLAW